MKKLLLAILAVFIIFIFIAGCGGSINNNSGGTSSGINTIVSGTVSDSDSLVGLDNATVTVGALTATTDSDGRYIISGISAGTYTITISRSEYDLFTDTVIVTIGTTTYNAAMNSNLEDWLAYGTKYHWQAQAVHNDRSVSTGPEWTFTTEALVAPRALIITDPVDVETAKKIAQTFINEKGRQDRTISSIKQIKIKDTTVAYLFVLNPAGNIIVPASKSDVVSPILSYSFDFNAADNNPVLARIINMVQVDMEKRLSAKQKNILLPDSYRQKNNEMWDEYLSGKIKAKTAKATYGPLLHTPTWGQSSPENDKCPEDPVTGKRCIVGCVATAYAQIFNYWETPKSLTFTSNDNYTTVAREISVTASNANFSNIPYKKGETDSDSKALLSLACGMLVRMNYTSTFSGANTAYMSYVMASDTRLGYGAPSIQNFKIGGVFDATNLINNIKASKPVAVAIDQYNTTTRKVAGSHAVVFDGYDDGYGSFHINFGWYGDADQWYFVPAGMPSRYNFVRFYVYNISPLPVSSKKIKALGPQNPYPADGDIDVLIDSALQWDICDNTASYNCFVWKDGEAKPSTPNYQGLRYPILDPMNI